MNICERFAISWLLTFALLFCSAAPGLTAGGASVEGTVVDGSRKPVPGARVTVEGSGVKLGQSAGAQGEFLFAGLVPGSYRITAKAGSREGRVTIDLAGTGSNVVVELLSTVGHVTSAPAAPPTKGSGTDVTVNQTMLDRMPYKGSLQQTLLQLPAAARGANGVVHINGDHGDLNYYVDGVQIPQELNRVVGSEIDPSNIAFMDVIEGAYPAQYGGRFAAVVNVNTRISDGPAGASGYVESGSFATYDSYLNLHSPLGPGQLSFALAGSQNWDASDGVLVNDRRGGWLAVDGEYGSELSSAYCQPATADCKVPPHTTFDLVKGIGLPGHTAITFGIYNIFNDRYRITYLNAQGNHFAAGRTFEFGWRFAGGQPADH